MRAKVTTKRMLGMFTASLMLAGFSATACAGLQAVSVRDADVPEVVSRSDARPLEQDEIAVFLRHIASIREQRIALEKNRRVVFLHSRSASPILDPDVLDTIDRLSGEYSGLQIRAMYIPVDNGTMKQIGLIYSIALGRERQALLEHKKPSIVLVLLNRASNLYAYADGQLSDLLGDTESPESIVSIIGPYSQPADAGF